MFGFCNIAVIPVRAAASHRAEMVTQLLFGEAYRIVSYGQMAGWAEIITQYDDYKGFIDINQIAFIHESSYMQYAENQFHVSFSQMTIFDKKRGFYFPISAGSTLLLSEGNEMRLGAEWFELDNGACPIVKGEKNNSNNGARPIVKQIASSFLNTPYLWGGRSMYGIDCSGFTQIVFKIMGKKLPRDASQQAVVGEKITSLTETQCGDLAFFQNKDGRITHTGLILDQQTIIHASGKVRIDVLDEQGIFCVERNEHSHRLCAVRRVL